MNKVITFLVIFILFSLVAYLFYINKHIVKEHDIITTDLQFKHIKQEKIRNLEIDSENNLLEPNIKLLGENEETVYLGTVCSTPKLIYRYSEINCDICIDSQIEIIKEKISQWGEENIIFISSYRFNRDLSVFKRINRLKIKIYNLKEKLPLPVEQFNTPYYFVFDPQTYRAVNVFIPLKENPSQTLFYLNSIRQKYFE